MDHKMSMLGIDFCYNTFKNLCAKHQHYHENDTLCLYIFFHWLFFCIFPDQWNHFCDAI